MIRTLGFVAALLVSSTAATAGPITVNGGWSADTVNAPSVNSVNSPVTFTLATAGFFRLTDQFIVGDIYTVFDGVTLIGTSSFNGAQASVFPIGDPLGDAGWTDGRYSHLQIALAAGSYSLNIQGDCAGGCPAGLYIRADQVADVPAPAAVALLGLGLLGVAGLRRRA